MLIGTTVEQIVQNARRLGLSWGWRPLTVKSVTEPFGQSTIAGVYDGDTASLPFTNLAGTTYVGARHMGLFVPPTGNYAVGTLTPNDLERVYAVSATTSSAVFGTTETVVLTVNSVPIKAQSAYEFSFGQALSTTVLNLSVRVRVRQTTVGGTLVADYNNYQLVLVSPHNASGIAYAKNDTDVDRSISFVLTMQSSNALLLASHFADANTPRFLQVRYAGVASDFPHALVL